MSPEPVYKLETLSGSTYELYPYGHLHALVKVHPDGHRETVVRDVHDAANFPQVGKRARFTGSHPWKDTGYYILTSPVTGCSGYHIHPAPSQAHKVVAQGIADNVRAQRAPVCQVLD